MAEPSLKVVSDAPSTSDGTKSLAKKFPRKRLRMILLVALPLIALAIGAFMYLGSGRYISTDNAYVGAQKVLITPDISGKIARIIVREGQHVKQGQVIGYVGETGYATGCHLHLMVWLNGRVINPMTWF